MKELKFLCSQPDDSYFAWQVHLWLESLKQIGHSDKAIILVFTPADRKILNPKWQQLVELYPEASFNFYNDDDNISVYLPTYIPILRPYILWRYFKDHPEISSNAVLYCDCDVVFTKNFNVDNLLQDEVCYLSDTTSYINASYFDSKIHDVRPDKLEEYKTRDILAEVASVVGVSREICELHNADSGGAQYLLKNIDASFWKKVMTDCLVIKHYLGKANKDFFESENKGFQSWCADMWAVLWNLWIRDLEVKVVPEMKFAWSPDPIELLNTVGIYHNAGITGLQMEYGQDTDGNKLFYPCFFKAKYHQGQDPFKDNQIDAVLLNEESKKHCTWYYAKALKDLHEKYKLEY